MDEDATATKLVKAPLLTVISPTSKSVVASLEVKVSASVASFDVAPSATSSEVIVIVGLEESKVQLNCGAAVLALLAASVKVAPATSIVVAPATVGVNVAL